MNTIQWGFIGCGEATEKKSGPAFEQVQNSTVVAVMSLRLPTLVGTGICTDLQVTP